MDNIIRFLVIALLLYAAPAAAEPVRVAVASNFSHTMKALAERFQADSDQRITLSTGSTGKHYAQIVNGAPFDLFLAADQRRPQLLREQGKALSEPFTYARGRLALWSPKADFVDDRGCVLSNPDIRYLAIANPRLAPYGEAAVEVIHKLGLWPRLQRRIVQGENIGQTLQFVFSGAADLGFVAYSQLLQLEPAQQGSHWLLPESMHPPIRQQAVLLSDNPAAAELMAFLRSDAAKAIIRRHGYQAEAHAPAG